MRNNQPVTQQEFDYPAHAKLVSITDTQGNIVHCNKAFVSVSGFTYAELIGQPHNLIRHPDMPTEAFRDMWDTIGRGMPWTALVKNRRKSGDHYWVKANVTPIVEQGQVVGYLSVRTKPSRQQIEQAERLYAELRSDRPSFGLRRGRVQRHGLLGLVDAWGYTTARLRLTLLLALTMCVLIAIDHLVPPGLATSSQAAAALVGMGLSLWWFEKNVSKPLGEADRLARSVAACNLTERIEPHGPEPIASLMLGLSQIQVNLQAVIGDVRAEVDGFSQSAKEIADASLDLSRRTESQASALEQTAASMEEISATVKHTSTNADAMTRQTSHSAHLATNSQSAIHGVSLKMKEIETSSGRMGDIIATIQSIAFQTNILALNAAVEAARAGEHGRGFAVVAGEVRALAQRSAGAANEIKDLIQSSVEQVSGATREMARCIGSIDEVVQEVASASSLVQEIKLAMDEQAEGLMQINSAVVQLDNVTQQNAAMVEQSTAAARTLSAGSESLKRSVSVFKL